jgi:hypothetical protein
LKQIKLHLLVHLSQLRKRNCYYYLINNGGFGSPE